MDELSKYQGMLKKNEAEIKRLTDENKHIKSHIKFLEATKKVFSTTSSEPLSVEELSE